MEVEVTAGAGKSTGREVGYRTKGRGHRRDAREEEDDKYDGRGGIFENIGRGGTGGPCQCKFPFV